MIIPFYTILPIFYEPHPPAPLLQSGEGGENHFVGIGRTEARPYKSPLHYGEGT